MSAPPDDGDPPARPSAQGSVAARPAAIAAGSVPKTVFDPAGETLPVKHGQDVTTDGGSGSASASASAGRSAGSSGAIVLPPADPERYERGAEIARGGMGRIIAARDRRLGRAVAIKELLDHSSEMKRRFEREALITAKLQHPSTVSLLEAGAWPTGELFYVMNFVAGQSLDRAIAARPAAEARFALVANVIAVVDTIAYAHNLRIIHRDLKPANVLCGEFGETVVIDWGLAKELGDESAVEMSLDPLPPITDEPIATQAGLVVGTPAYMPPEQADGEPVDERADVYALGAMLYHVLAGAPPYTGRTAQAVLAEVLAGPPAALATVAPGTPPDLVTIVGKAMARAPEDRYRTAVDLAADLKKFQTGQLVGSHAYTIGQLLGRWLRRHRAAVAVAAVALLVLASAGAIAVRRIVREQRVAEEQRTFAEEQRRLAEARGADAEELMGFMLGDLRDKLKSLGKLELLDSVAKKAVEYHTKRAAGEDSRQAAQRARALQSMGDVELSQAAMPKALAAYREASAVWEQLAARDPANTAAAFGSASNRGRIGGVLFAQGDVKTSAEEYRRAIAGLEAAAGKSPDQPAWHLELATAHRERGDVLLETGDLPGGILHFRAAIGIGAAWAAKFPADPRWQRIQAVGHSQLGGALLRQGDAAGALAEHRADVAISERLAAAAPKDMQLQYEVAAGHSRIGDVLRATGDQKGALAEFRTALGTAMRLATSDPGNADWQHDVAISHDRVGNVLLTLGDAAGAGVEYRAAMEIKRRLVEKDPTNLYSRRNLAVGHNKVGNVKETQKDLAGALAEYKAGVAIMEEMTRQSPDNAGWQRDLSVGYYLVAEILHAQRDHEGALAKHRASAAIAEKLAALDPQNSIWQADVLDGRAQVAKVLVALRQPAEALAVYRRALSLAEQLAAKEPANPAWAEQAKALSAAVKTCCGAAGADAAPK